MTSWPGWYHDADETRLLRDDGAGRAGDAGGWPPPPGRPGGRWRDVGRLVPFVVAALTLSAVTAVVSIAAEVRRLGVLADITARRPGIGAAVAASDRAVRIASALDFAAYALAAVVWLVWFARLYDDAGLLGRVRFPAWKVWGWLVPFVSLFRPKQLMNDVWAASGPEGEQYGATPRNLSPLVHVWWGLYLGSSLLQGAGRVMLSSPAAAEADAAAGLRGDTIASILGRVVFLLAAGAAIALVLRVTARVEGRARERGLLSAERDRSGPAAVGVADLDPVGGGRGAVER